MKQCKKVSMISILALLIILSQTIIFARSYSGKIVLPETGKFAIPYDQLITSFPDEDTLQITSSDINNVWIVKDTTIHNSYVEIKRNLEEGYLENSDVIYYINEIDINISKIIIGIQIPDIALAVDVYIESSENTYTLLSPNNILYNFANGISSLEIELDDIYISSLKFVFKNSKTKLDLEEIIPTTLIHITKDLDDKTYINPIQLYEEKSDDGLWEYMFDLGSLVFVDKIDIDQNIEKIFSSNDFQNFNPTPLTDIGNGLYTRFIKIKTKNQIQSLPMIVSYRRYIIASGEKDDQIDFYINVMEGFQLVTESGEISDYILLLDDIDFEEIKEIEENDDKDLTYYLAAGAMLFLIYPIYLLYKHLFR